jgi:hypothetical protein
MKKHRIVGPMITFILAFATPVGSELRHVEIKTLGMD